MEWLEKLFNLAVKAFALPSFHAIVTSLFAGFAVTYLLTLPLPAWTPVKWVVQWARLVTFLTVFSVAVILLPTPTMVAWAGSMAIFTPLFYEWAMQILYHRYPWMKPKALLTASEMQVRIKDKPPVEGGE